MNRISDTTLYILYAGLLAVMASWTNPDSVPPAIIRLPFLLLMILPLYVYRPRWTPLILTLFITVARNSFAGTFLPINMLCYVLRDSLENIYKSNKEIFGNIFENFVATEIIKNIDTTIDLSYFRTVDNKEIDFVLQNNKGEILAIEVKTAKTVTESDTKAIQELQKIVGNKLKKGIVFYTGNEIMPIKKDIWAVPVNYIWQ